MKRRLQRKGRTRARERYWSEYDQEDHSCRICGTDGPLEIHHRDGDYLNNELINLVALCHHCHTNTHRWHNTKERVESWKDRLPGSDESSTNRNMVYVQAEVTQWA